MQTKAIRVDVNGTLKELSIDSGDTGYDTLLREIGGYFNVLSGPTVTCYLDEEGMCKNLACNANANLIARTFGIKWGNHDIVGPVIFLGPADEEGNDTSLTQKQLETIRQLCQNSSSENSC